MVVKERTIGQWLEELATTNTSSDRDANEMQNLLRRVDFPNAMCTLGIVYLQGHGRPVSIHSMARLLVEVIKG